MIPADIDEEMLEGELPVEFAVRAAGDKGLTVATRLAKENKRPWIVSADTVVVLGDEVLVKPKTKARPRSCSTNSAGRKHIVVTGWAVGRHDTNWRAKHLATHVQFHPLTNRQIDAYVATGEGMDKAGAYAIQGIGSFLVDSIEGNYLNVVGLPISHVVRDLIEIGALPDYPLS